jgi:hypothetical protein
MKKIHVSGALICFLAAAVALALYYGLFFNRIAQKTSDLTAQHQQKQIDISNYESAAAHRGSLQKAIAKLKTQVKSSEQSAGMQPLDVSDDLVSGLHKADVSATNVSMEQPTSTGIKTSAGRVMSSTPLNVTFICNESQLVTFLHYIEKETGAVYYIDSVTMQPRQNGKATQAGLYTASLKIFSYSFPPAAPTDKSK